MTPILCWNTRSAAWDGLPKAPEHCRRIRGHCAWPAWPSGAPRGQRQPGQWPMGHGAQDHVAPGPTTRCTSELASSWGARLVPLPPSRDLRGQSLLLLPAGEQGAVLVKDVSFLLLTTSEGGVKCYKPKPIRVLKGGGSSKSGASFSLLSSEALLPLQSRPSAQRAGASAASLQ